MPNEPLAMLPSNVTLTRLVQALNALLTIDVTFAGIVMEVRLVQLLNAALPIVVTFAGIVTLPLADG